MATNLHEYILLPKHGLHSKDLMTKTALLSLPNAKSTQLPMDSIITFTDGESKGLTIIDSIKKDGPKLALMDSNTSANINNSPFPLRAVPIVYYERPSPVLRAYISKIKPNTSITIICRDINTGVPISEAQIICFSNFNTKEGASAITDALGKASLALAPGQIDRVYVNAPIGYWGAYRKSISVSDNYIIELTPISLTYADALRSFYPKSRFILETKVRVGVIDTGIGPHKDINLLGGSNTVTGELASDFFDSDNHGTHVAGLIGAQGIPPNGLRGMAPGVELRSYRVFGKNSKASSYAILKAMIYAGDDGCDIINLSLGGGPFDPIIAEAIEDARGRGMLVIVAAGNDGRKQVSYPAAYAGAIAVSATGIEGTFPAGSLYEGDVDRQPHSDKFSHHFIANFSNIGPEIAVTGLGVGVLSTLPNNQYGPMSGTSMAAPVITGATASLLSQTLSIYNMNRDRNRSLYIERLLQQSCLRQGFGNIYEGYGIPDHNLV